MALPPDWDEVKAPLPAKVIKDAVVTLSAYADRRPLPDFVSDVGLR